MKKFFKRYFWTILIVISALGLAGSAAYFSISGLSKLFAGSALQVIIMASFIEFAKIGTTAALHRYWKSMKGLSMQLIKWTLAMMVVVVMVITSSGIYGFLADAYSTTAMELEKISGQIELVEKKQEIKREKIIGFNEAKELKVSRIKSLIDLKGQQENRVDSLEGKNWYNAARRARAAIVKSDEEIAKLGEEIDTLLVKSERVREVIGVMDIEILDLKNSDVATEIGPLKYMSTVVGKPVENIINWFILMIIFVFDPLAILLIVFANIVYDRSNENNGPPEEDIDALKDYRSDPDEEEEYVPTEEEILEMIKKQAAEAAEKSDINAKFTFSKPEDFEPIEVEVSEEAEPIEVEVEEPHQKIVDAINNTDPDIMEFSYDIPEEEVEEVVEYIEGDDGGFEKANTSIISTLNGIDSNPDYLRLLDVLFLNGNRKSGDVIPPYYELNKDIKNHGIKCDDKVVKNFLTICNLLDITNMSDKNNVTIMKDYKVSKNIILLVSK